MSTNPRAARRILILGRAAMLVSALAMVAAGLAAYPLSSHLGFGMQVAAHIALPVAAALFKLGYVARLASHHALGNLEAG